ncbi:hypothetical protein [Streptomyces collinus]|uniref:hypothetical protein n=1 Tax=Streptomyces collinus TaxID=42684 RepID=UPI00368AD57A
MSEPTVEQQLTEARTELARLRAGLAAGLTPDQSARLQGTTPEELTADAQTLARELNPSNAHPPSGSGSDVGSANGTLDAGAARYRQEHGLDEDGRRPEARPVANPFQTASYRMER